MIVASCTGDDPGGEEVAQVVAGDMAEVSVGGVWATVGAGEAIPAGARLRTGEDEARIAFSSGEVWFAPQAAAVIGDDWFRLERGEALADSDGGLESRWDDVEVSGEGVYRLALGIDPRIGVYSGQVRVRRPAEVRTLPALREASLAARRLAASGQPLTYRPDDPWDQVLLRDAIAFDREAERLARGLSRAYGTEPRSAEFYAAFAAIPGPAVGTLSGGVAGEAGPGSPGETLLRLFVAQSATPSGSPDALVAALRDIADLRAAGARWGLVATEMGVTATRLAEVVDVAQARYTARLDPPAPAAPPADAPPAAAPSGPPPATEPSGSSGQTPAAPSSPTPDQPEPAPPPPPSTAAQAPTPPPPPATEPGGDGGDSGPGPPPPSPGGLLGQPVKGLVELVVELLLGDS
ncbi:MAG: hypothetical protein WD250_15290 [Egibacteraceae bacterium]